MPLREINLIEVGKDMYLNYTMAKMYDLKEGDVLVGEVRRFFTPRKKLKGEVNEKFELELKDSRWINLDRDLPILKKYDIQVDDYLEIVYYKLRRGEEEEEIFPGENKEYLDFNPDEEY